MTEQSTENQVPLAYEIALWSVIAAGTISVLPMLGAPGWLVGSLILWLMLWLGAAIWFAIRKIAAAHSVLAGGS